MHRLEGIADDDTMLRELTYLQEHGLVTFRHHEYTGGHSRITAKGIDFLADDGGLGAILGVVTLRLDTITLQNLLIDKVEASSEPETTKRALVKQIRSLPADAMKTVVTEVATCGPLPNSQTS